jgi:hypothetical protein
MQLRHPLPAQIDRQAEDRAHRIGQNRTVTVYRLVTEGTVDERVFNIAQRKKRWVIPYDTNTSQKSFYHERYNLRVKFNPNQIAAGSTGLTGKYIRIRLNLS